MVASLSLVFRRKNYLIRPRAKKTRNLVISEGCVHVFKLYMVCVIDYTVSSHSLYLPYSKQNPNPFDLNTPELMV